jgi:hypothetical protein
MIVALPDFLVIAKCNISAYSYQLFFFALVSCASLVNSSFCTILILRTKELVLN